MDRHEWVSLSVSLIHRELKAMGYVHEWIDPRTLKRLRMIIDVWSPKWTSLTFSNLRTTKCADLKRRLVQYLPHHLSRTDCFIKTGG